MRLGSLTVSQPAACAALLATAVPAYAFATLLATAVPAYALHSHAKRRPPMRCPEARLPAVTVSPLPGTPDATPQTQISILGAGVGQLRSIFVIGSQSGRHTGVLRSYQAAPGASFLPSAPFDEGEHVSVCAVVRTAGGLRRAGTSFTVASVAKLSYQPPFEVPGTRGEAQAYHSTDVKPPKVTIAHQASDESAVGDLFATPYAGPAEHGAMIFESSGRLIWFHRPPNPNWAIANLQLQSFGGHEDLVWWQGAINTYGFGFGEDVIANDAYEQVARVRGGNGLSTDLHAIQLTPSGAAFVTAYCPVRTSVPGGGPKHAGAKDSPGARRSEVVLDSIVQEIDVKTGLVMWEWQSLGHVPLSRSHQPMPASGPYDYFHIDSLQALPDGDLLIDARNTWALYDLRRHTGRIAWQLGGRHSSFKLSPGVRFGWPEDAQMLSGEQVALYDGGVSSGARPRGEVLQLEPSHMTASLLPTGQLTRGVGGRRGAGEASVQPLPGGGWIVGFGGLPNFAEFGAEDRVTYDARFPASEVSYRIYREPWHGQPSAPPNVVATTSGASTTVYASWNGATEMAAWVLLAGPSPLSLEPVTTVPSAGFETAITAHAAAYVKVEALNAAGTPLTESKPIAAAH